MKGYEIHMPAAEEPRLLARLSRHGLGSWKEGPMHLPPVVSHLARHAPAETFLGRMGGTRIEVRVKKRSRLEVRVTFVPPIAFRKAWGIVTRLRLRPTEGTWT